MAKKLKIMQCECDHISKTGASNCKCYDANGKLIVEAAVILFKKVK